MSGTGRLVVATLLAVGTAVFVVSLRALWSADVPWWFSLLFTVMLVGLPLAAWVAYISAIRRAGEDLGFQGQWAASRGRARLALGHISDRAVQTSEAGTVTSFVLTVDIPNSPQVKATWHPARETPNYLLQTQVPGVGAEVRVWLLDSAEVVVVEVVDPSVVPGAST